MTKNGAEPMGSSHGAEDRNNVATRLAADGTGVS